MMKMKREGEEGPIVQLNIKYLLVLFIFFVFFLSTFLYISCGWMPEFEDKAIKFLRNTEPTTITPTLMLKKLYLRLYIFINK